ncbi:ATP-binding protein [Megasphaera sueciensis]|uniref:ATP-binding protein n=1 Tax=Megasphaera sueciensis TaxID=349094 RepID=UPI003CFEA38E
MKLQTKIISFISVIFFTVLTLVIYEIFFTNDNQWMQEKIGERASTTAAILAVSPDIVNNINNPYNYDNIQRCIRQVQQGKNTDSINVIDKEGRVITDNSISTLIEETTNEERVILSELDNEFIRTGYPGDGVKSFYPIYKHGERIGAVIVEVTEDKIGRVITLRNLRLVWVLIVIFAFGLMAAITLSQSIKGSLLGMEPRKLAWMMVERTAIIQSIREGIMVTDENGSILFVNEAAQKIYIKAGIQKPGEILESKFIQTIIPNTFMTNVLQTGKPDVDRELKLGNLFVITSVLPLVIDGRIVGSVGSFRELEDIRRLSEELTGVKKYVEALRVQAHEFRNQIHVISGLIINHHYDELSTYVQRITLVGENELKWIDKHMSDSILSSFLQSKLSFSREMGVNLIIHIDNQISKIVNVNFRNDLITVLGNLIDNAIEAVQFSDTKNVELFLDEDEGEWYVRVSDTGSGIAQEETEKIFMKGYSTKGENRGFGLYLIKKTVEAYAGHVRIDVNKPKGTIFTVSLLPIREE